jgi:hypothetical protein
MYIPNFIIFHNGDPTSKQALNRKRNISFGLLLNYRKSTRDRDIAKSTGKPVHNLHIFGHMTRDSIIMTIPTFSCQNKNERSSLSGKQTMVKMTPLL